MEHYNRCGGRVGVLEGWVAGSAKKVPGTVASYRDGALGGEDQSGAEGRTTKAESGMLVNWEGWRVLVEPQNWRTQVVMVGLGTLERSQGWQATLEPRERAATVEPIYKGRAGNWAEPAEMEVPGGWVEPAEVEGPGNCWDKRVLHGHEVEEVFV